jgi:hypothetical protein
MGFVRCPNADGLVVVVPESVISAIGALEWKDRAEQISDALNNVVANPFIVFRLATKLPVGMLDRISNIPRTLSRSPIHADIGSEKYRLVS